MYMHSNEVRKESECQRNVFSSRARISINSMCRALFNWKNEAQSASRRIRRARYPCQKFQRHKKSISLTAYRIVETSRSLLGKDGTGGDGPTEKLGDVGEGGATIGSGIEGGGRIGRKESGGGHDGGGKNKAGHGCYTTIIGQVSQCRLGLHEMLEEVNCGVWLTLKLLRGLILVFKVDLVL